MSTNWKPGDRALCVDDSPSSLGQAPFKKGAVYLVRSLCVHPRCTDGVALYIAGIEQPVHPFYGIERPWKHTRFRKIVPACDRVGLAQEQGVAT